MTKQDWACQTYYPISDLDYTHGTLKKGVVSRLRCKTAEYYSLSSKVFELGAVIEIVNGHISLLLVQYARSASR